MSIGIVTEPESFEEKDAFFTNSFRSSGIMCLSIPPYMHYLIDTNNLPSELWSNLDKTFGLQDDEEVISHLENDPIRETSLYFLTDITTALA